MNSSNASSQLPPNLLPPDLSDRERCLIALQRQLQSSLDLLPDTSAHFLAPLLEQLNAISAREKAENAALLEALKMYQEQCQSLRETVQRLTAQLIAMEKKLENLNNYCTALQGSQNSEQAQRIQLAGDIRELNTHVTLLHSQLVELNGFAPR